MPGVTSLDRVPCSAASAARSARILGLTSRVGSGGRIPWDYPTVEALRITLLLAHGGPVEKADKTARPLAEWAPTATYVRRCLQEGRPRYVVGMPSRPNMTEAIYGLDAERQIAARIERDGHAPVVRVAPEVRLR